MLYEQMPLQCKQCALRFHDDARGKTQMQDHLDAHFRQNRRAKESVGRGHSRSWFISIQVSLVPDCIDEDGAHSHRKQDFLSERADPKGKGREIIVDGVAEGGKLKRESELRASTVDGEDIDCLKAHSASFSDKPAFQLTLMTQGWDCSR